MKQVIRRLLCRLRVSSILAAFAGRALPPLIEVPMPSEWTSQAAALSDDEIYRSFAKALGGTSECITEFRRPFAKIAAAGFQATGSPFVDVGCGAGEFLGLLAADGIPSIGVDTSERQTSILVESGYDVRCTDAVGFLQDQADCSLGGVSAFNVIEHMPPDYLLQFLRVMSAKVRVGGRVILQTSSPQNPYEASIFTLDLTHQRMYHPLTVSYYVAQMGFGDVRIVYQDPAPVAFRLSGADVDAMRSYAVVGTRVD